MLGIASRLNRFVLDAQRVVSSGSVAITWLSVSNNTASDVEVVFENNEGAVVLSLTVPGRDSRQVEGLVLLDKGLTIRSASSTDVSVSVAFSQEGA